MPRPYHFSVFDVGVAMSGLRWDTGWKVLVPFPTWQIPYLLYIVQTGSGAHPASFSMGTGGDLPGNKAAWA
jgi:hypothetical protein